MTPERWQLVKEKLDTALNLEEPQRAAFLRDIENTDPALRQELDSLLVSHKALTDFMNTPPLEWMASQTDFQGTKAMIGRRIGAYQIIEQIGAGGMGEVYRAFRADDQYRKEVAIKLVRAGRDSAFVVNRFRQERQILANLDHPNIARLLDGGSTDDGVPYFVMELITGQPIDEYCQSLAVSERLQLFLHVCSAVQYAHQRLIIHRDIKPGNILVTTDGTPKLLDFGIAKILDPVAAEVVGPSLTQFQGMTPGYASPEQIQGAPITTAADVYSLGVVLYELLTGQHPYLVAGDTAEKIAHKIRDTEPRKPSSVVREISPQPRGAAIANLEKKGSGTTDQYHKKLQKRLRGDLDNIVLMALRKEPLRRYASVEQFGEDIRRHLQSLPVSARSDTAAYRASKFARRHRVGLATTAVVIVALMIGLGITLREKRRADRRFNDVRSLANSLLFEIHDSIRDLQGSTPARKLIIDRALQYLNSLSADSGDDPTLLRELATAYERVGEVQGHYLQNNLGDTTGSLNSYQQALLLRQKISSKSNDLNDSLALARSYHMVANQQWATGAVQNALANAARAVKICEGLASKEPRNFDVLYELSFDYALMGDIQFDDHSSANLIHSGAAESYTKAMTVSGAMLKMNPDNEKVQSSYKQDLTEMANILNEQGDLYGALEKYQTALTLAQAISKRNPTTRNERMVAVAYNHIAGVYDSLNNSHLALENYQNALAIYQQLIATDPQNRLLQQGLGIAYGNVSVQLSVGGKNSESRNAMDKGLQLMKGVVEASPQNLPQQIILAAVYEVRGSNRMRWREFEPAQKEYEECVAVLEKLNSSPATNGSLPMEIDCKAKTGIAAMHARDVKKARAEFEQALDLAQPMLAAHDPDTTLLFAAADSCAALGKIEMLQAQNSSPAKVAADHWKKAQSWYARSLDVWKVIPPVRRARPTTSIVVADLDTVTKALHRCETFSSLNVSQH